MSSSSHSMSNSKRIRGSISRIIRKRTGSSCMENSDGPHWRPSVNALLVVSKTSDLRSVRSAGRHNVAKQQSRLVELPKEIRHLIEEYVLVADAVCLRETCLRLRHESKQSIKVQDLNGKQRYILRKRLDRDSFPILCSLENDGRLGTQLAICSFCLIPHERKQFTATQLRGPPEQRICNAAAKRYLILGNYWAYPSVLRRALADVLATGRVEFPGHHWMPSEEQQQHITPTSPNILTLSRAIENNPRTPERRATLYIDDSGLVVEHHFHLQSQSTALPIGWNFAVALANPHKGITAVCPHQTIHSAGSRLGGLGAANLFDAACPERPCETLFGWFECASEAVGWEDLCFRVLRRFGWLENMTDAFWRAQ